MIGYLVRVSPKKHKRDKKYIGYLIQLASKRGHSRGDVGKHRD